jgi:hypothetical protein
LARRPSGRFADFSEIGVHTCLCLKLVGGKGCGDLGDPLAAECFAEKCSRGYKVFAK